MLSTSKKSSESVAITLILSKDELLNQFASYPQCLILEVPKELVLISVVTSCYSNGRFTFFSLRVNSTLGSIYARGRTGREI